MRRLAAVLVLGVGLALAGCASNPASEGTNADKAADLNAKMGLRYMMQGHYERSMEKLKHALFFDSRHGPAHHYMAVLFQRLNRPEDAEKHFRDAIRAMPDDSALRNNFGVFLCGSGRQDEAEMHFLKVLNDPVYPQRAAVYENLGLCMKRKGDSEKAEAYLRQALSRNTRLSKSLLGMAELSFEKKNYLSARGYLQRYLAVARHTPESLWLGIRVEKVLGNRDALASYEILLKNRFSDSEQARLLQESEQ